MNLIAAVDKNWAIGNKGRLLVEIPADHKIFREETLSKVVVMGRKTLATLPGKQPLYGRTNIVLSNDPAFEVKGAIVCHSVLETLEYLKKFRSEDIYIIGGESIYAQFIDYCDTAHITAIDYEYLADSYFPNLDQSEQWKLVLTSEEETFFSLCYEFRMYQRIE